MRLLHRRNDYGHRRLAEGHSKADRCRHHFANEPPHLSLLQLSQIHGRYSSCRRTDAKGGRVKNSINDQDADVALLNVEHEYNEMLDPVDYDFGLNRRSFVQILGAGLLLVISAPALAQERGGGGRGPRGPRNISARLHIGTDGIITVMCGKVEGGQGSRTEFTQAAAEELR